MTKEHPALRWMHYYGRQFPGVWERFAVIMRTVGERQAWPKWCHAPSVFSYLALAVEDDGDALYEDDLSKEPSREQHEWSQAMYPLSGLVAWRATQGIYRLHPALLAALVETPVQDEIPCEVLQRLPEWCVYVETPGEVLDLPAGALDETVARVVSADDAGFVRARVRGFFAWLDCDPREKTARQLRFLVDLTPTGEWGSDVLVPLGLDLNMGTVRRAFVSSIRQLFDAHDHSDQDLLDSLIPRGTALLERLVSVVLYLCADDTDGVPRPPRPPRVVQGKRRSILPTPKHGATVYECGARMGAALDAARFAAAAAAEGGTGNRVQPHIRRAHWHTFLLGPRSGPRERRIRWLAPIAVNLEPGEVPPVAVIRPVRGEV